MPVYACGSNLHGQVSGTDRLHLPTPDLIPDCSEVVAASWSQLVCRDAAGNLKVSGLSLEGKVTLNQIACWLGQDSFEAGLRDDGTIERFVDGARTEQRYSLASMNSKGEVLVVPRDLTTEAHLYSNLDALFSPPSSSSRLILSLPSSSSPIPSKERISSLSTFGTAAHFLLLSSPSQTLYSWGDNRYGQCGPVPLQALKPHSAEGRQTILPKIEFFDGLFPDPPLHCGAFHSAVRTRDGAVYVFGSDKEGQLGGGEEGGGAEPEMVELSTEEGEEEEGNEVVQVACGSGHTVLLTRRGEVWVAGANHDGQLGLSDLKPRLSFVRNDVLASLLATATPPQRVKRIHCARWTTYFEVE
ncbi:hypothetical protein JCM11251_004678 [Rhodosporidiobolus azoricus]